MSVHAVVKISVADLRIVFLFWCRMVDLTKQLWILPIALAATSNSYEYTGETMWWSFDPVHCIHTVPNSWSNAHELELDFQIKSLW